MPDPQSIQVTCSACAKSFGIPAKYAGKKIKCPGCKEPLAVPAAVRKPKPKRLEKLQVLKPVDDPDDYIDYDDEYGYDHDDDFADAGNRRSSRRQTEAPRPLPPRVKSELKPSRVRRWKSSGREGEDRETGSWLGDSGFIGGLVTMAVAVIWFVVGLYAGWLFYYPPIMFILGLIAVCRSIFEAFDE